MAECERTLDGKHHWTFRAWAGLGRWSCVCAATAPAGMIPKLKRLAAEAERINELVLCAEPGEQGRLPL